MIENIYSNMGGREGEYQISGRRPPKNLRQIGYFSGDFRIYLEDYVHTFTHWLAEQDRTQRCVAVLVGEFAKSEHAREVYAYGAVVAEHACDGGKIEMTSQVWAKIYETIKEFFPDGEIVGWFCGGTSFTEEEREEIRQVHTDHFAGTDRILMLYDFLDREEEFYRYEENGMARQDGYYIYYEKNTEMQEYMIEQKQGKGSEENVNDRAVQEVRARWNGTEKREEEENVPAGQEEKTPENGNNRFLYLVGIAMSAVALVAAASMLYNQERLKGFEQTLNRLIGNVDEEPDAQEASGKVDGQKQGAKKEEDQSGVMSWGAPDGDGAKGDSAENNNAGKGETGEDGTGSQGASPNGAGNKNDSTDNVGITPAITQGASVGTITADHVAKGNAAGMDATENETKTGDGTKTEKEDNKTGTGDDSGKEDNAQSGGWAGQGGKAEDGGTGQGGKAEDGGTGQGGKAEDGGTGQDGKAEDGGTGQDGKAEDGGTGQGGKAEDRGTGQGGKAEDGRTGKEGGQAGEGAGNDGKDSVQTAEIGGSGPAIDTSNMQFYTVKPGDTLTSICRKLYGNLSNLEYIKGLNQLNDENLIYVDQELLVP